MPWATPPITWPSTIIGLMMVPQSSTATYLSIRVEPVSGSTSTTQMWVPDGKVQLGGSKAALPSRHRVDALGQVVGRPGGEGELGDGLGPVGGALDLELAVGPLEVVLGHLELVGGQHPGLLPHPLGRLLDGHAPDRQAAAAVGVQPPGRHRGVAVQHLDVVGGDAEGVGHDLGEGGVVALAVGGGPADHGDLAGGVAADRGPLPAAAGVLERGPAPGTAPSRRPPCSWRSRRRAACRRGGRRWPAAPRRSSS